MTDLSNKIKQIRDAEDLSRVKFGKVLGISDRSIEAIENQGLDPKGSYLQKICMNFPKYTSWLMMNEVNIDYGQISPQIENEWERNNLHTINVDNPEPLKFDRFNKEHITFLKNCVKHSIFKPLIDEIRGIDKTNYE